MYDLPLFQFILAGLAKLANLFGYVIYTKKERELRKYELTKELATKLVDMEEMEVALSRHSRRVKLIEEKRNFLTEEELDYMSKDLFKMKKLSREVDLITSEIRKL